MSISDSVKNKVSRDAEHRCGYCRMPVELIYAETEIDHLQPRSKGGADTEDNLWLSRPRCNGFKGDKTHAVDPDSGNTVALFNPRNQTWGDHFEWNRQDLALINGKTDCGRATVAALKLNFGPSVKFRQFLVEHGKYPPPDEYP